MVSLKRIKAMIKTVGVYIVDTTADIPEPNLLRILETNHQQLIFPRNRLMQA